MNDPNVIKMLDELLGINEDDLTSWEIDFTFTLDQKRDQDWSRREVDKLQRIYDEKVVS